MRCVDYSTWRVFYSVFVQGAWSCLMQNIDVKARHSSFLPRWPWPCVDRARKNGRDGMGICNLINHGWTRIWFANAHRYYVMACAVMLGGLAIAAESISITATPRYPWNGKVDLKFTIDGTSGTKYDTSFTAKE